MPAKTFIRGFVKSYAEYLKLDAEQVLRQFQEEMGSTQPLPKTPPPQPADIVQKRLSKTVEEEKADNTEMLNNSSKSKTFIYTGIAVIILILTIAVNKIVDHYQKQKLAQLIPQTQTQTAAAPLEATKTESITPANNQPTAENTNQTGNISQTIVESAATQETNSATKLPEKPVAADTAKPIEKLNSANPPEKPIATTASVVEETFDPAPEKPVEIIVEARKEVEFFYAKGNTKKFTSVKLKPKQIQVIRSPSGIHVKTNDGSAIILTVNGVERGTPSSIAKPFKASY